MRPDRRRAPAWIGAVGLVGAPLLAAAVLLSAGPAGAAPPWSVPAPVPPTGTTTYGAAGLAFTHGGQGLLTFIPSVDAPVLTVSAPARDRFAHTSPLTGAGEYLPDVEHDVAVYGRDRLIVAGGLTGTVDRAWAATGRIGSPHGPRQPGDPADPGPAARQHRRGRQRPR